MITKPLWQPQTDYILLNQHNSDRPISPVQPFNFTRSTVQFHPFFFNFDHPISQAYFPSFKAWDKIVNHISVSQNRVIPGIEFKITDCSVYADGSDCKFILFRCSQCCTYFLQSYFIAKIIATFIFVSFYRPKQKISWLWNRTSDKIGRGCHMQDLLGVICNFVVSNVSLSSFSRNFVRLFVGNECLFDVKNVLFWSCPILTCSWPV